MIMLAGLAILIAVGPVLWQRRKERLLLERLNQMLDIAIAGDFTEEQFDESLLSVTESKLARYLAASTVSAKNLRNEKDSIKTLIADISHQTKTPIANILLYTQLLQEQTLPAESRDCVNALEGQAQKLQVLIEALVKTSRLESGIIALQPMQNKVAPMVRSAVTQLQPKAGAKGVILTVGDLDGTAVFDAKWTEEALFNLLDNGVKYTPAGGTVQVQVNEYPMFTAIQVSDSGVGISEEEHPKVFQRFYRGLAHRQEDGVGIGLYLARQIAEGQGGYIKLFSQPGQGSTFSLYLPRP